MAESFSESLRQEAFPIWESIFAHPFLEEIEAAELPLEKFRYYVEQDYHYLAGFGQVVATALSKAPDTRTLRRLTRRITTPVERPLHGKMFELLEMNEESVEAVPLSPTNMAYINHMQTAASMGGVGRSGGRVAALSVDIPQDRRKDRRARASDLQLLGTAVPRRPA